MSPFNKKRPLPTVDMSVGKGRIISIYKTYLMSNISCILCAAERENPFDSYLSPPFVSMTIVAKIEVFMVMLPILALFITDFLLPISLFL